MAFIRTILYPTDFSESAQHAFRIACALARDQQARLLIAHVIPPPVAHGEVVARRQGVGYEEEMRQELHRIRPEPPIPVDYYLEEGQPAAEIVRLATENKCDLIVMGTHGRTGLGRLLMGSVAEHVLRGAPCPVLTIKASGTANAE